MSATQPKVSEAESNVADEADLDHMVQKASTPSLASLFKQAKDAGLIQPGKEYGSST